jgi:hypothetical protein
VRTIEEADKRGGAPVEELDQPPPTPATPSHDGAGIAPTTRLRPPGLIELEELLAGHLDTRVNVQRGPRADLPADDGGVARQADHRPAHARGRSLDLWWSLTST